MMITTQTSESKDLHPLARFVTPKAIALLLEVAIEDIKEIRCWQHVILVVGRNFSRFVSYADLPPILSLEPPKARDFVIWHKRWHKNKTYCAPSFWQHFYAQKFRQAASISELYAWGQLIGLIKFGFTPEALQIKK